MRLKSVRIFGFKTFAEKVEFNLDADIIAIVGPNGCGKSNIVDAILWGLGEPNARNLRATSGVDVIFNGSAKRKPLGYAEVTLLFDNEDGSLPIEAAEVAISRKINRAGESHFSINRRTCRLKDIYDLLADSGLGRAGYAIVGQSEIDQALSASAEERRAWIDEAAGVQRFRSKRVESLRRLDAAKDHLSRIEQILSDIEFQRNPLKEEAELAKRCLEIKSALSDLEVNLLVKELQGSQAELDRIEADRANAIARSDQATSQLDALREKIEEHGHDLAEIERKLDAQRELRQSRLSGIERAESAIALAQQRLASLDELEQDLNGAQDEGDTLLRDAEAELRIQQAELEAARSELALQEERGTSDRVTQLRTRLNEVEGRLDLARSSQADRLKREAEASQARRRLALIQEEVKGIASSIADLTKEIAPAEAKVGSLSANTEAQRGEVSVTQAHLETLLAEDSQLTAALQKVVSESSMLEGRKRGIESTLDTMEGLGQGAKAVLELCRSGRLSGSYTPVSNAIEVSERYAVAIETALGGAAHDLITPDDRDAKAAIQQLKASLLGRATFQPLNLVNPAPSHARSLRGEGIIGVAADLVKCSPEHRGVVEALLGRIVVVETLDESIRLAGTKGWSRLVTLDGEVVHSGGAVTGGRNGRQGTGLVQRRAELATILHRLDGLVDERQKLLDRQQVLASEIATVQSRVTVGQEALNAGQRELAEAKDWLSQLQRELASTEREGQRLERERDEMQVIESHDFAEAFDLEALSNERDLLLAEYAKAAAEDEAQQSVRERLSAQVVLANERILKAAERLERAKSGSTTRAERLAGLSDERKSWAAKIEASTNELHEAQAAVERLKLELEATQSTKKELLEAGLSLAEEAKDAEHSIQNLNALANKLEVERARCESRRATADQRLLEDYAISQEEALVRTVGEFPEDAQAIVSRLRRDLKALGDVNVGSIEAYDRLSSRFVELDAQRDDVQAGMDELQGAVKALDRLTRDRFLNTFDQVRSMFSQTFAELFGGGEAELSLTNEAEVISAGVQVSVTVPGKKRQRLELLSGGERSMSAIAFLFALLRVKSSPLVVLDEVDAPLDGRNVERFVEVLNTFKGTTQFLVITHNPVTIEAAPLWFGVTMQEPGCTSILPYSVPAEVVSDSLLQSASNP